MFKKWLGIGLMVVLVTLLVACSGPAKTIPTPTPSTPSADETPKGVMDTKTVIENALKNKYQRYDEIVVRGITTEADIYYNQAGILSAKIWLGPSHRGYLVEATEIRPESGEYVSSFKNKIKGLQGKEVTIRGYFWFQTSEEIVLFQCKLIETP